MAKNIELALAFEFEKAPDDLKKIALVHKDNFVALEKARSEILRWQDEFIKAEKAYFQSGKEFRKALDAWEVDLSKTKVDEKELGIKK